MLFFSLSGYRYLGDGGTDRREILHGGTHRFWRDLLPFRSGISGEPPNPKFWLFWPFDREYLENGKSERYMSITA